LYLHIYQKTPTSVVSTALRQGRVKPRKARRTWYLCAKRFDVPQVQRLHHEPETFCNGRVTYFGGVTRYDLQGTERPQTLCPHGRSVRPRLLRRHLALRRALPCEEGHTELCLDRIIDLKERFRYFTPLEGFDLKEYLSRSWGIIDAKEVTVTVKFFPEIADYILRKTWHSSEQKTILPDGSIECTYTVAGTIEIKQWIYSWLPHAEVLEPEWFREQVQKELSASFHHHCGLPH
jgi:hypothetical protein